MSALFAETISRSGGPASEALGPTGRRYIDSLKDGREVWIDGARVGKDVDVEYKSRLFQLAHDLAASSFGLRQEIYEYWHGGDPNRNRISLLRSFDQKRK